jgi:hypothetical protein
MGLFDEVRCEAPLPDGLDGSRMWFQTKSFPSPCLQRYTITKEGKLVDSRGNDIEPDGYIIFYGRDDSDADPRSWLEYRARFREGVLDEIVRVETDERDGICYGLASFRWFDAPTYLFGDSEEDDSENPAG